MSSPMIKVDNLSKRYRIGAVEPGYRTLREAIMEWVTTPVRNFSRLRSLTRFKDGDEADVIWALKDVSFEVNEGEVLGIIGSNGAGKSTLLKILSRITEPTSGSVKMRGRVSSLLEVGTGFHPELTGRENIFLNGAILGMHRKEIERKFDEIVAFAEIEKFVDTPVKRYSSGMYVRLAFAVAAHLEPEILLVDEVLAVGDAAFQRKCLGKMGDIAKGGRTVLFISHNTEAVRSLCESAVWLDNGQIVEKGPVDRVVSDYEEHQLRRFSKSAYIVERESEEVKGKGFYISCVELRDERGERTTTIRFNEKLTLLVDFAGQLMEDNLNLEFHIYNELGQLVCVGASGPHHGKFFKRNVKKVGIEVGPLMLTAGEYRVLLTMTIGVGGVAVRIDKWENAIAFSIVECRPFATKWQIPTFREGACVINHSFREVEWPQG